jgi:hypothetical protein
MRRALCVGIDEYPGSPLTGCVNDATRMHELLSKHQDGAPNFDSKLLVAPIGGGVDRVSRAVLRKHTQQLFQDAADVAFFFFAGHGTVNNLDGFLVTQDAKQYDEGVALQEVLTLANDSKVNEVVVMLDSCYSGNMGNVPAVNNAKSILREGVSILTASRGDQPSVETGGGGIFTSLAVDALEGGAANLLGSVNAPAVYAFVEAALGAWDQRPLFKAHVSKVIELRCCTPPIERAVLRRIPDFFPLPAEDYPLDPSFESTSAIGDPTKVAIFGDLQALSRVHLVTPVGAVHMYDAAMNSTACRLTPTGRYYWRLAKGNRI